MSDTEKNDSNRQTSVEQLVSVERVSFNVAQSVIVTTEDKVRLSLESYQRNVKRGTDWIAPLSVLTALIATLSTATFNNFILDSSTWKAVFIIAAIGSAIWLIKALLSLRDKVSLDELIEEIKTGNKKSDSHGTRGMK